MTTAAFAGDDLDYLDMAVSAGGQSIWEFRYDNVLANDNEDVFGGQGWMASADVQVSAGFGSLDMVYDLFWSPEGNTTATQGGTPGGSAFVVNNFSVTNNTGQDQLIVVDANMLFGSLGDGTQFTEVDHSGQVAGGLTDADGSGNAFVSVDAGQNLYEAFVDGVSSATMYEGPQLFETNVSGGSESIPLNSFSEEDGAPNPSQNELLLRYTFTLSAGDSMSISGFYFLQEQIVPAPGALALLGLAGFAGRRRRRA